MPLYLKQCITTQNEYKCLTQMHLYFVDVFQAPKSHQNVVKTAANFFIIFLKGFKFSAFLLNSKEMALF